MIGSPSKCPKCGGSIPIEGTFKLCPVCLLELGREDHSSLDDPSRAVAGLEGKGRRLGDYELIEELARGGMGVVFKARQIGLNRIVAVKTILAEGRARSDFIQRFRREARAAAKLSHPNIVAIHEVGEAGGRHFFSMEYIGGVDLAKEISRSSWNGLRHRIAPLAAKIARAVQYAHERGILHRDLKPSNVMIDAAGEPHLTDFGLAREFSAGTSADLKAGANGAKERSAGESFDLTITGQTLGSPHYMPPEQIDCRSGKLGATGDVYSIGAMLFHLLTGRPPFLAENLAATLAQTQNSDPVSPRLLNPRVPKDLETICLKCLEKDPARRYPSAEKLAEDLERFARGVPILARPVSAGEKIWRRMKRFPVASALCLALAASLIGGVGGVVWQWRRAENTAQREEQERRRAESLLNQVDVDRAEDYFASGRHDRGIASLARALRREPGNRAVAGRLVAALSHVSHLLPLGPSMEHPAGVNKAVFNRDGSLILTAADDGRAYLWDGRTFLPAGPPLAQESPILFAVFHPEGAMAATATVAGYAQLWRTPNGARVGDPIPLGGPLTKLLWNDDGSLLAGADRDGNVRCWNVGKESWAFDPLEHGSPVLDFDFNPHSSALAAGCEDGAVRIWNWDKETAPRPAPPLRHSRKVTHVRFSPDGTRLLTASHEGRLRLWDVETGALLYDIAAHSTSIACVQFNFNGTRIASGSWDRTARITDALTGRFVTPPLRHGESPISVGFVGGGEFLATGSRDARVRLWDSSDGRLAGAPARHDFLIYSLAASPDGRRLLTASKDRSARVMDARSGKAFPLRLNLREPVVAAARIPGSERLLACSPSRLVEWDPAAGRRKILFERFQEPAALLAIDAEGKRIAVGGIRGWIHVFDREGNEWKAEMNHGEPINSIEFSGDGSLLLTAGGAARVWDLERGVELASVTTDNRISRAAFNDDGDRFVTASWDRSARVWDARTSAALSPKLQHDLPVLEAAFDPSGRWIATASRDQKAGIWEAASGRLMALLPHRHEVRHVRFSPDGATLATASGDHQVYLWRVPGGDPAITRPFRYSGRITGMIFSNDGKWLATASHDGIARVWSAEDGSPLTQPIQHRNAVSGIEFDAQAKALFTASWDGTVLRHELPVFEEDPPPWLPELAEAAGGLRLAEGGREDVVAVNEFVSLKDRLLSSQNPNEFDAWAGWFLADRGARPISFRSKVSTSEFIERCLREGSPDSLRAALQLDPSNRSVLSKLNESLLQR